MSTDNQLPTTLEAKVFSQGTIKLPMALRNELGIQDSDKVLFIKKANTWEITTHKQNITNVQAFLKTLNPENMSLVDELIQERHKEAVEEADNG